MFKLERWLLFFVAHALDGYLGGGRGSRGEGTLENSDRVAFIHNKTAEIHIVLY